MDPIEKRKYPIYHPSTSRNHPHPPPTMPSSTSIHSISNNFSKLYTNHKITSSLKQTDKIIHPHPHPEPSTKHAPTTTLTKSKSQHGTRTNAVKDRVLVKAQLVEKFLNPKQVHETTQKELVDRRKFGKFLKPKEAHETAQKEWKTKELVEVEEKVKQQDVKRAQAWMSRSYSGGFDGVKMGSLSRRKSFCSSKMELADFFLCSGVKLVAVDMPPHMQIHAVDCARKSHDSLEKFTARSLACTLKREFDGVYGPAWHCIVGTSFGSFVTHSVGGFMYFSMDQKLYILLFKTTVQKAE